MNWPKLLVYSNGAILLAAASERFIVAFGHAQALSMPDPLIGLPLRFAVLLVGVLELTVALICLFGKKPSLQLGWVAWLAMDYILFRAGLFSMGYHSQVTCIGALTDPLCLARGAWGAIITFLPAYLLASSIGGIAGLWLANRKAKNPSYYKMPCPACGVNIQFSSSHLGWNVPCPHCETPVKLRNPDQYLKMSCFFCKGHIEFPLYAAGTKLKCPHCKKDITLKEPATV